MSYQTIITEKKNGYATVKLNRLREMNAICKEMRQELYSAFVELEGDPDVKAIILTGGEYVFSAGMDIKEMASLSSEEGDEFLDSMVRYLKTIYSCKKPVIAAVGGIALGGGFNLVTVCDLVVASESAIFCHPELKFGFNPLFYPLSQIVGETKAKEIVMLGEPIGANEALKLGMVNKVAPPEKFMEVARNMAAELATRSSKALEELKNLCSIVPRMDRIAALDIEFSVCSLLFARDDRKAQMDNVLLRQKMRKKISDKKK
ncbi:MAG TPA: enoyl-CoA hydratase/isomerase family protein [Deltaproteobacteria bacterium]|nr:enoyl-CoA hydratase/isomerase family protein [Deltaproteobacteria bacterium]